MRLVTETPESQQQILIVAKAHSHVITPLTTFLEKYGYKVFISPHLPPKYGAFQHIFYLLTSKIPENVKHITVPTTCIIFDPHLRSIQRKKLPATMKVVLVHGSEEIPPDSFDKIIWFTFSTNIEQILTLTHHVTKPAAQKKPTVLSSQKIIAHAATIIRPRNIIIAMIIGFLLIHIAFIFPLGLAYFRLWQSMNAIQKKEFTNIQTKIESSRSVLQLSKSLYAIIRPTYLITGFAHYPDSAFTIHEAFSTLLSNTVLAYEESQEFSQLIFSNTHSPGNTEKINTIIDQLTMRVRSMEQQATTIQQKLPRLPSSFDARKKQLQEFITFTGSMQNILPLLRNILAPGTEKTYVFLFANNMELRPGGGFIGSFAVVHIHNYVIDPIQTYDVYDADGQLVAHVDPPTPIAKYLNQPHWFLRDSAFSADYPENVKEARFFLDKTMKLHNIDGVVLITTSAVQRLLQTTGPLSIPDFKESVTADNFYIKAQLYAEKDFFPGSIKKKQFLSSVFNQLLIQLQDFQNPQTLMALKTAFDEKQIVASSNDDAIQAFLDNQYWSGRMLPPTCASTKTDCISDYIFPVEANLGVNKANFYMRRSFTSDIDINSEGKIRNRFTTTFINDSLRDVFPGGTYKNYFQVFLPPNSSITRITKNDVLIEKYEEEVDEYHRIGIYIEIKPQEQARITIEYTLNQTLPRGKSVYQLIMQKQIGLSTTDTSWTIHLPKQVYITNQNVSTLVKDNTISYNHLLATDTIFYFEMLRE